MTRNSQNLIKRVNDMRNDGAAAGRTGEIPERPFLYERKQIEDDVAKTLVLQRYYQAWLENVR